MTHASVSWGEISRLLEEKAALEGMLREAYVESSTRVRDADA